MKYIYFFQGLAGKFGPIREKMKNQFKNLSEEDRDFVEAFDNVSISSRKLEQQERDRFADLKKEFLVVKVKRYYWLPHLF